MSFRLLRHGTALSVTVDHDGATVEVLSGNPLPLRSGDHIVHLNPGESRRVTPGDGREM
jgi:hypothetical protein